MVEDLTARRLRSGFGPIYRRMSRSGNQFTPNGRLVLMNLLERLGQNSRAWPAQERIADDVGCSVRTVINALEELKKAGFITARRRGQGRTNDYTLALDAILEWAETGKIRTSSDAKSAPLEMQKPTVRSAKSAVLEVQTVHFPSIEDPQDEDPPEKIHQQKGAAAAVSMRWLTDRFRDSGIAVNRIALEEAAAMERPEGVWVEALREAAIAGNTRPSYLFAIVRRIDSPPGSEGSGWQETARIHASQAQHNLDMVAAGKLQPREGQEELWRSQLAMARP